MTDPLSPPLKKTVFESVEKATPKNEPLDSGEGILLS